MSVNATTSATVVSRLQTQRIDGYDALFLEAAATQKVSSVISDDGDFCTIAGLTLFTANSNVINAAAAQKRLITR
jgi:hypothetical protein